MKNNNDNYDNLYGKYPCHINCRNYHYYF